MRQQKQAGKVITHGALEWRGPTKAAAAADRDQALARLFGDPTAARPTVALVGGHLLVVFQAHHGLWAYGLADPAIGFGPREYAALVGGYASRLEAEDAGRRHLAQRVFKVGGPDGFACLRVEDVEGRHDHTDWVAYQVRSARLAPLGFTEYERHELAGRGPRSPAAVATATARVSALAGMPVTFYDVDGVVGWSLGKHDGLDYVAYELDAVKPMADGLRDRAAPQVDRVRRCVVDEEADALG